MFFFLADVVRVLLPAKLIAAVVAIAALGHFVGAWDVWLLLGDLAAWAWMEAEKLVVGFFDWLLGQLGLTFSLTVAALPVARPRGGLDEGDKPPRLEAGGAAFAVAPFILHGGAHTPTPSAGAAGAAVGLTVLVGITVPVFALVGWRRWRAWRAAR